MQLPVSLNSVFVGCDTATTAHISLCITWLVLIHASKHACQVPAFTYLVSPHHDVNKYIWLDFDWKPPVIAVKQASVRCLGHWGRLLEIGKYDILQGTHLSMKPLLNNIAYEGVDVDRVLNHPESTEVRSCLPSCLPNACQAAAPISRC